MPDDVDPRRAGIERFLARRAGGEHTAEPDDVDAAPVREAPKVRTLGVAPPPKTGAAPPAEVEPDGGPAGDTGTDTDPGTAQADDTVGEGSVDFERGPAQTDEPDAANPDGDAVALQPSPTGPSRPSQRVVDPVEERARTVAAGLGAGLGARIGARSTRSDHPDPAEYGRRIGNMRGVSTTVSAKTAERLDKQASAKNQTLSRCAMDAVRNHYRDVLADLAPEQDPDDPFGTPPVSVPHENYGVRKEFSVTPQEAETLARLSYEAGISPSALLRTCIERDVDPNRRD